MNMDIKQFQKLVIEKAKKAGFDDCEIYYQGGESFQVIVNNNQVEHYETSTACGASFRGVINQKTGFAYTERIDEEAADFIIKAACENAEISEADDQCIFYEGGEYPKLKLYNEDYEKVNPEQKVDAAIEIEKAAIGYSENIKAVDRLIYADDCTKVSIMNTKGLDCEYCANTMAAFVSVIAQKGNDLEDIKMGGDFFAGNDFNKFNPKELGEKAAKEAENMLGAKSVKSGIYNVIIRNSAMADILSTFSPSFTGEQAFKGLSMLEGKEGSKVASDCVTIRDDGLLENGYATAPFDGEGVPCQNTVVVEKGVLKTLLYDLKYAEKTGKKSTGNAQRGGFKSPIVCDVTNFYIEPSKTSLENLAKQVGEGILITSVAGLHSGANPVSGDFSLSAEGFLIEDGKITTPVEQITAAANFFKLLENIQAVGSDLKFDMGGSGSPSVFVKNVSISGL